jgi:ABC-type nitrate/sulfonate/bicarbonate transport system substrate-binding protein
MTTTRTEGDVTEPVDRRAFLRRGGRLVGGAALVGVAGPGLLEACSSSSKSSTVAGAGSTTTAGGSSATTATAGTVAAGSLGALSFQLPWIKNVESAGEFIADTKGIYIAQGFSSINLIAAGPNATPQETVIKTGQALMAVTSLDSTAAAIQKGFNLIVIGTEYQINPFCIMSPLTKPLNTPQDMIGKKIGVQTVNDAVWAAFLKANSIDAAKVNKVTVGFDPTPITQGQVDGWFSFITNEPIDLGIKGFKTKTFLLNDFNYPEVGNVFIVTTDSLKNSRDKVKACMVAEIMGWQESITTPAEGAQLAATKYGQGLDASEQTLESKAQNKLVATGDALTSGMFYITPRAQAANVKTLALGGTTVTTAQLFDMSVLDEIYQASPNLKLVPPLGA